MKRRVPRNDRDPFDQFSIVLNIESISLRKNGESWENHRKIIGNITIIIMAVFGCFMVKLYLNNWFNGLIGFSKPWRPVFMAFIRPKIQQQIIESIWEHPGKYYLWKSDTQ